MYKLDDYDYNLPEELIAQTPAEPRDSSRLLILNKEEKRYEHKIFSDIYDFIKEGDLLIVNNTKVIPARLYGQKDTGAKVEILLLEKMGNEHSWKALVKPGGKLKKDARIIFSDKLSAKVVEHLDEGARILEFEGEDIWGEINRIGKTPLPPYIKNSIDNSDRYQTRYAKIEGAVAAPTAGLHFTDELINKIKNKGARFSEVTLHVGLGTFRPVNAEDIREHNMHEEFYTVEKSVIDDIIYTKKNGGRVIAVGTTVVRTLESIALNPEKLTGKTNIFIYPPFEFKYVDAIITNFHLPKSTLLLLISAFAGYDFTMDAYKEAVENKYRFFSFGDAMFIY